MEQYPNDKALRKSLLLIIARTLNAKHAAL